MQDVVGSPFSVQAYEPDERMGGWTGLDAARTSLAQRGMALVVDFVTNHTAFDHEWIRSRPDLYVEGTLDDYRTVTRSVPADRRGIDGSFRRLRTRPVFSALAGRGAAQLLQPRNPRRHVRRARVHR